MEFDAIEAVLNPGGIPATIAAFAFVQAYGSARSRIILAKAAALRETESKRIEQAST